MFTALLPFLFLGGFIASIKTFMFYYGRYRARSAEVIDPWYPEQAKEKNAYQAIRSLPNVENHHLMAGLLLRAKTCVDQLNQVQATKPALTKLFQTQHIDDALQRSLMMAEATLVEEISHVVREAKSLLPEWPKTIFITAVQMREFEKLKQIGRDMVDYRAKQAHIEKIRKTDMGVDDDDQGADDLLIVDNCDHLLD